MRLIRRYYDHFTYQHTIDRVAAVLVRAIQIAVLATMLWGVVVANWLLVLVALGIAASMLLIDVVEYWRRILFPTEIKAYFVLFFYMSMFWGGYINFYERFWWYDILMHLTSAMALALCAFVLLYVLQNRGKLRIPPWLLAVTSFACASAIGVLWEIFEFVADTYFGQTMQGGNQDTMLDLIFNSLGALLACLVIYQFARSGKGVIRGLMHRFYANNPSLE